MVRDRRIVLGVTGGIAAYKAAELTRLLVKGGASVKVVMTGHAQEFVTPLTFQTLSENPVYTEMYSTSPAFDMAHISLASHAELVIVAPATANLIGAYCAGMAGDLLTTLLLAVKAPVLLCPAMNENMYRHPAVRENMEKLRFRGVAFLEPDSGHLACGVQGTGRLPAPEEILEEAEVLLSEKDLEGEHVLVTAGPTQEPFDPVRFITNHSSGKMGYALARVARRRGAAVTLVSGPTALPVPRGVRFIAVSRAVEMRDAVMEHLAEATVVIKAAAVADYRPERQAGGKIKKTGAPLEIRLTPNPDILAEIARHKGDRILVGFAMESDHVVENARRKLSEKNLDFIVANDITREGAGFRTDTNIVQIVGPERDGEPLPLLDKIEVAGRILDRVRAVRRHG